MASIFKRRSTFLESADRVVSNYICGMDFCRQKGFKNLYTLRGGVAKYLKEEGASQWNGRLFVFDSRLSVPPVFYHGSRGEPTEKSENEVITGTLASSARCLSCGVLVESVHRNCANIDCNKLYL